MSRLQTQYLLLNGVISTSLYNQINKAKTHEELLQLIRENSSKIHSILINLDYDKISQSFINKLIDENLLEIDDEYPDIYNCVPATFRQYTKKFDDSLLLYIPDKSEKIEIIQNIYSPDVLYQYILNNPSDVHLCLVWANWESFTFELVFKLVREKLLDINKSNNAYDTNREKNISFKTHCVLLFKEMNKSDVNYKKMSDIVYFLVHFI